MNLILGTILLASGAWAAPIDQSSRAVSTHVKPPMSDSARRALEQEIRADFEELGYPEEATAQHLAILDLDNLHGLSEDEKAQRMDEWHERWAPVLMANSQRKALLDAGYPPAAVDEYPAISGPGGAANEKTTAEVDAWHHKWDSIMLENAERKFLLEQGYSESAVAEYLELMRKARSEEPITAESFMPVGNWHTKYDHMMIEKSIRDSYRALGFPDSAIEEYLALADFAHPELFNQEKSMKMEQWSFKRSMKQWEDMTRKDFEEIGYPIPAIDAYMLAMDSAHPETPDDVRRSRMNEWEATWLPVVNHEVQLKALRAAGYSEAAIQEFFLMGLDDIDPSDEVKKARKIKWEQKNASGAAKND